MARINPQSATWNREDRDLLVELRTKLTGIETKLSDMSGNYTARLLNLESNAVNQVEFGDHETRIRQLETQRWLLAGAASAIGIIGGYVVSIFF